MKRAAVTRACGAALLALFALPSLPAAAQADQEPELRREDVGFVLRHRWVVDVGPNHGATHVGQIEAALRVPTRSPHLAFDFGVSVERGSFRIDERRTVRSTSLGLATNAYVFLNPQHQVQVFGLAGFALSMGSPVPHEEIPEAPDDDCAATQAHLETSFGVGTEFRFRYGGIALTARAVRRQAISYLYYYYYSRPNADSYDRVMWGLSVGVQFIAYLRSTPEEPKE